MNFGVSFCNSCSGWIINDTFYISQDSGATQLSCGGKHDTCFVANFLQNPKAKEFCKLEKHLAKMSTKNTVGFSTHSVPLRFMLNAWLCARYKLLYYYYY